MVTALATLVFAEIDMHLHAHPLRVYGYPPASNAARFRRLDGKRFAVGK